MRYCAAIWPGNGSERARWAVLGPTGCYTFPRANGYIDGLLARPSNRLLYPPFDRFAYLAGYADGEKCRPDKEIKL